VFAVSRILIVMAGITVFILLALKYFIGSQIYKLKHIEVKGLKTLTREEIIKVSGLSINENIFRIKAADAKKCLKNISRIDTIEIIKNYPDTVVIEVKERVPVARVELSGNPAAERLMDANGIVFPGSRAELPRIVNAIKREELRNIASFMQAIKTADQQFFKGVSLINGARTDELRFLHGETEIIWGIIEVDLRAKLADLKKVMEDLKTKNREPQYIDARFWEKNKRDITVK